MTPTKFPYATSRESVQVVLRESTSISPVLSGSKRSLAESGVNLTLIASFSTAAAMARQKSTSNPFQLPLSSGFEKPGRPWLTPQMSKPRSLTALSVCAFGAVAGQPTAIKTDRKIARFMNQLPRGCFEPGYVLRYLRTIGHQGQGVDARAAAGSSRQCGHACPRSAAMGTLRERAIMKNIEDDLSRRSLNSATRLVLGGRDPFA